MADYSKEEALALLSTKETEHGLPKGMLSKVWKIESNEGDPNFMVSKKGAKGHFQFIPSTGAAYGLQNEEDFYDLDKSSTAAAKYLSDNLKRFKGDTNLALVDYNGGPKAVKAYSQGKPFAESADYLAKYNGGVAPAPLTIPSDGILKGFKPDPISFAPTTVELAEQRGKRELEHGGIINTVRDLPDAISLGFTLNNSVYNLYHDALLSRGEDNTPITPDYTKELLAGIPPQHYEYVMQGTSHDERLLRKARLLETMVDQKKLAEMGLGVSLAGGLVGGLLDLPSLLMFVPGAQGEMLLTTTSRITNAIRMGAVGGATNLGYDALTHYSRPTSTPDDLWISALMGLGMGALAGGAINPKSVAAMKLARENDALRWFGNKEAGKLRAKEIPDDIPNAKEIKEVIKGAFPEEPKVTREPGIQIIHDHPEKPVVIGEPINDVPRSHIEEPVHEAPTVKGIEVKELGGETPWEAKWNTPEYKNVNGFSHRLELPDGLSKIEDFASYIRQFSIHKDLVLLMDRILENIPLDNINFQVLGKNKRWIGKPGESTLTLTNALGAVATPYGSTGGGLKMALADRTLFKSGGSGLNEETFIHELLHAATVYKINALNKAKANGAEITDPVIKTAVRELNSLHKQLVNHAKLEFGGEWKTALEGRLGVNLQNPRELLSYGLTNRNFQEWMKTVQVKQSKKTLWDSFVDTLASMLGIQKGERHALAKLVELSSSLTQEGGVTNKQWFSKAGMSVDQETLEAVEKSGLNTVFGWGLGLENRLMNSKMYQEVRDLSAKLIGTTIGFKDHAVVARSVWDDKQMLAGGWVARAKKAVNTNFEQWFTEAGGKTLDKNRLRYEFDVEVGKYIRNFEGDYSDAVKKAGDELRKVVNDVREHINNPMLREGGVKRGLTETELLDELGNKTFVGKLEENPFYLPRKHDKTKWDSMVATFGKESVERWYANAFKSGRPDVTDEAAKKWAGWYINTVNEAHANRSQDLLNDLMRGADKESLKQSMLRNGGFTEEEAAKLIADMFPTKETDTGRLFSSLKHRNSINETYSETWKLPDGTTKEVTINDFIHAGALEVLEPYFARTAGNVALAKHLDVYKVGDIDNLIMNATRNEFGSGKSGALLKQAREDLKLVFDEVQSIPREEFTPMRKGLQMWRDFNVIRLMGGTVWNQASELAQIVGTMGWKNTLEACQELKALQRDIASGKAPHDILEHLENFMGGVGAEYVQRLSFKQSDDWVRNLGDSKYHRMLDKVDNGFKKMARGVLDYTGMTPLMIQQKRTHAIALVNHFVKLAHDDLGQGSVIALKDSFLTSERLAWMGMSPEDFRTVMADLKAHCKPYQGEFSKTHQLDFDSFMRNAPESHAKLATAIHRETRRVIQENDLASMIPVMGTTLGKTVFQFMNFSLQGWNKSLMFSMNHKDWSTLSTAMWGGMLASLAYMGRTHLAAMGMDETAKEEFLTKRMDTKQIVANSFGRTSQASILPNLYDATLGHITGPQFSGMRTTSDLSGLASNPTLSGMNAVLSLGKIVRNGISGEEQTTQGDIRKWGKLIPLNNVVPISTLMNALANDFPKNSKE